jgi:putative ABC transport system substrate-binding protein
MTRREFITLIGGAAGWPLAARAQQSAMPVVGFLNAASPVLFAHVVSAFRLGLKDTGYVERENVAIEYRWAENQYDRLPELARDLVRHQVNVIVAGSATLATLAAKAATTTIPIVILTGAEPGQERFVASLSRPRGNLTGVTTLNVEIAAKRLEALRELLPTTTIMAVLVNPINYQCRRKPIGRRTGSGPYPWAADDPRSPGEHRTRLGKRLLNFDPAASRRARDQRRRARCIGISPCSADDFPVS